ncbi:MAG TPA: recombinase-like helix-turn-helix domain-containing protein [Pusillimonas sp.]|uniref:recombinase-like helix-turn-helix domain-containing protein n=1 Tax=Pusillimonas sp. TaxID=3040095 RepID=UPI002C8B3BF2|nr:recombinase-like helix-turn-helix domain-containing protein [Pusillimonas sp.]HUH88818.1 recombinase-like helix-turn-helix domain-containing protein [Pusillimonas sp.]
MSQLYLQPHQARKHEPTAYENLLGDSLERAFTADIVELEGLVAYLNNHGPQPQDASDTWTAEMLAAELKRLGAD